MLLIITPDAFVDEANRLRRHKEETGMLTTITSLSQIYLSYPGPDEAEKVKRCIAALHAPYGIRYVLLFGDSDVMPVRYTKTDRRSDHAADTAFYATDLYYAALYRSDGSFDDWDSNGNGYYGELNGESHSGPINIDGVSLTPTVAVGRVPASTVAEAKTYVDKAIRYENAASGGSWVTNAILLATHDWYQNACTTQDQIATHLTGFTTKTMSTGASPCSSAGKLTTSAVTNAMNQGVGLVGYIGHGSPAGLAFPGGWGTGDIANLTNTGKPFVMAVSGCDTAQFATLPPYRKYTDVNGVDHAGTAAGEHFNTTPPQPACLQKYHDPDADLATKITVGSKAGAVAYIGGITGMQYSDPYTYFVEAMPDSWTVGDAWRSMIVKYYQVHGQPGSIPSPDWTAVARVHQPWKFMLFGDPSVRIRGERQGSWSRQNLTRADRGTSHGPAVAVLRDKLVMVWKGKGNDVRIFYSIFDGHAWSPQHLTSGDRGTSHAPALASLGSKLVMVWKGLGNDQRIFYSMFDGHAWSPQQVTRGDRGTSHAPALATLGDKLVMVWKGKDDDPHIFYSIFDGHAWSPQRMTSGDRGTSHGPAVAALGDKLVMVWKGKDDDPHIFYSIFDGNAWSPQRMTSGDRGTSHGPAVAALGDKLVMVWKGKGNDVRIFNSIFDGHAWSPQHITRGDRGTSHGPAAAALGDKLVMVWKGKDDDPRIFYSYWQG
jgi:hypothetical protein